MDGGLLRPLSRDQMSPAGPLAPAGTLAGDWELLRCRWSGHRLCQSPAHPPPSLEDFARVWAKLPPPFPADKAGDGDGAEVVVGKHHLGPPRWDPSIAYRCIRASSTRFQAFQRLFFIQ